MGFVFWRDGPAVPGPGMTVTFSAFDEARKEIPCFISAEALRDHFGGDGKSMRELCEVFEANRPAIEAKAVEALQSNGGQAILLKTAHFRS